MNTNTTIQNPGNQVETGKDWPVILVRFSIPAVAGLTPSGNIVGTVMLRVMLEARLQLAGVAVKTNGCVGEFNQAICLIQVDSTTPALAAIIETLKEADLLNAAEVGWFDEREGVVRLVHPIKGKSVLLPMEEFRAGTVALDRWNKLLELAKTLSRTPPPGEQPS